MQTLLLVGDGKDALCLVQSPCRQVQPFPEASSLLVVGHVTLSQLVKACVPNYAAAKTFRLLMQGLDLLRDLLAIEPAVVLNAAFCERHLKGCPQHEHLKACDKVVLPTPYKLKDFERRKFSAARFGPIGKPQYLQYHCWTGVENQLACIYLTSDSCFTDSFSEWVVQGICCCSGGQAGAGVG